MSHLKFHLSQMPDQVGRAIVLLITSGKSVKQLSVDACHLDEDRNGLMYPPRAVYWAIADPQVFFDPVVQKCIKTLYHI